MEEYEPGSIRTYLMQMGDIPLLSRREELATAQRIEQTRRNLRRAILKSDYVLQSALGILDDVLTGRMRTRAGRGCLAQRSEHGRRPAAADRSQPADPGTSLDRNRQDFRAVMNRGQPVDCRRQAHRRLALRRRRAARLIDEIGLRMQRLQLSYQGLCEMGKQMAALGEHLARSDTVRTRPRRRQTRRRWTTCA